MDGWKRGVSEGGRKESPAAAADSHLGTRATPFAPFISSIATIKERLP